MKIYQEDEKQILISPNEDPLLRDLPLRIQRPVEKYLPEGGSIFDLGCGVDCTSIALARAGFSVAGLDLSQKAISIARNSAETSGISTQVRFMVGDATEILPEKKGKDYDGVVCSEVIEHIQDYARLLNLSHAVLKDGGCLFLTTPHDPAQWTVLDKYAGHVRRFRIDQIREDLASDGFTLVELFTVGFPFMRLIMQLYNSYVKVSGKEHYFRVYGQSPL